MKNESHPTVHQHRERVRVLLLEMVTHERWVFESRLFPFIQGYARQRGGRTCWLCFGEQIRTQKTSSATIEQYVDLGDEDLATLAAHVRELKPTHVVINQPLSAPVLAALGSLAEPQILSTSDHPAQQGVVSIGDVARQAAGLASVEAPAEQAGSDRDASPDQRWLEGRTQWLSHWLGEAPNDAAQADGFFPDTVTPDYAAVMANERARSFCPHLLILGGITCDHFHKVGRNPHFDGVELSGCTHDFGCSYCTWYRGPNSDMSKDPVALAERQLRRVVETAGPDGRLQGVVDLLDIRILKRMDRFAEMVLSLDLPPTTFCLEPRIDRVLQLYDRLERALGLLQPAGHGVYLFRMGAENLVDAENELFNKHLVLAQLDEGRRRIEALEQRFPDTFEADPTWGYITCTPWTSLEDLELGLLRAVERGFEPLGVWLYTPLLLYRHAPITRLAERDGLVQQQWDDVAVLYEPSVNGVPFDSLTPHRFKDERTAAAFGLITRFCAAALRDKYPDTIFGDDALYQQLLKWEAGSFLRPDLFALEVLAALKQASPPPDLPRLLRQALASYEAVCAEQDTASSPQERAEKDEGQGDDSGPMVDAAETEVDEFARRFRYVLQEVIRRLGEKVGPMEVGEVRRSDLATISVTLELDDQRYDLFVADAGQGGPYFFRTPHFLVSYRQETPLTDAGHVRRITRLVKTFDAAVTRHVPELLFGTGD